MDVDMNAGLIYFSIMCNPRNAFEASFGRLLDHEVQVAW
jgi:hypothetical protein